MSSPRVAFANSTNIPRNSRSPLTRSLSKSSSRKAAPTCTVSLASVSTNDLHISHTSISCSTSSSLSQNLIPFPSSTVEGTDPTISQSDRSCLLLLRSSCVEQSERRNRALSCISSSQERRKRSTARLLKPTTASTSELGSTADQPPRKRPRLHKVAPAKSTKPSPINSSDLKAHAIVQRCVAAGVLERRGAQTGDMSAYAASFDDQDRLLASHLRLRLVSQGIKTSELFDLEGELDTDMMNVDGGILLSSPTASVNMDVDVEAPIQPVSILCLPPRRSVPLAPGSVMSPPQLVAALILRNHSRKPSRPSASSEWTRKPSPLAASAI
ncbi:hypothetical protein C0991_008519 [Blastosporella zonata]|nr:hypothetical protein C0991_008519 [Blastosporella zonata]